MSGRQRRFTVVLLGILLVIATSFFGVQRIRAHRFDRQVQMTARDHYVTRGDLTVKLIADGTTQMPLHRLRFRVSGTVNEILVQVGDIVEAKAVIATLEEADFVTKVRDAELRLREALARLERARQQQHAQIAAEKAKVNSLKYQLDTIELQYAAMLQVPQAYTRQELELRRLAYENTLANYEAAVDAYERLILSPVEYALEELAVEQARATLHAAEASLAHAELRAPIKGKVVTLPFVVGDIVSSTAEFAVLADTDDIRITADILELDIDNVALGQPVQVQFDAVSSRLHSGKVLSISPLPARVGNLISYSVVVGIEDPPDAIRSGMSSTLTFILEELYDVLLIPAAAVRSMGANVRVVEVRDARGNVEIRPVKLGASDGRFVEVISGLNDGARVVLR